MERLTTPFGFFSTADEVAEGIDLSGKQVVITGGASGIGLETARTLAHIGAEVTLAVRNTDAGKQAAADIMAATGNARIVVVSSSGHLISPVVFDDLHFAFRPYDPLLAYGQSKTATILFAVGATARWAGDGITTNALMPGAIATNLQRHVGGLRTPPERRKTPQQGAATSVLLAVSPLLQGVSGRYFEDCNEALVVTSGNGYASGVAPYALNAENADRLWEASLRLLA